MLVQIIASGILMGLGVIALAQGTVVTPTQIRWLLSGVVLLMVGAALVAQIVLTRD